MRDPVHHDHSRGRILVVDDDDAIVVILHKLLERSFDLALTTRSTQALDWIVRGDRYDVILCDLLMPELTGMDLHERLCQQAPDQAKRMIFVTGGSFNNRVQRFLGTVANPHLEKPFDLRQLLVLINARLLGAQH